MYLPTFPQLLATLAIVLSINQINQSFIFQLWVDNYFDMHSECWPLYFWFEEV